MPGRRRSGKGASGRWILLRDGYCGEFPFRLFEVDRVIPQDAGCGDHFENLQRSSALIATG